MESVNRSSACDSTWLRHDGCRFRWGVGGRFITIQTGPSQRVSLFGFGLDVTAWCTLFAQGYEARFQDPVGCDYGHFLCLIMNLTAVICAGQSWPQSMFLVFPSALCECEHRSPHKPRMSCAVPGFDAKVSDILRLRRSLPKTEPAQAPRGCKGVLSVG